MNRNNQFRVLFRQFAFRITDEASLAPSAGGDASKLLAQYAGILFYLSLLVGVLGLLMAGREFPPGVGERVARVIERLIVSTTMLLAGLLAVFTWDACLPDHRDVLVLLPLPVKSRTIFLAKVAAVSATLALMVGALHSVIGLIWPAVLAWYAAPEAGLAEVARAYLAYWVAVAGSAVFVFGALLCVQGALAVLPRAMALRLSPLFQVAAFSVLLAGYFLEAGGFPPGASPLDWFLGLYEVVAGNASAEDADLASRAWMALASVAVGVAITFAASYVSSMRRIAEQPAVSPDVRIRLRLPRFAGQGVTALVHFQLRTLGRSRQHRFLVALFLGLAFAVLTVYVKTPLARLAVGTGSVWAAPNAPILVVSVVMLFLAVAGCRVAFAMPTELKANWIFQLLPLNEPAGYAAAMRRTLLVIAVGPAVALWAAVLIALWPWQQALGHAAVLGGIGAVMVEASVAGFRKIPFTCSYLPGKANVYYYFFAFALLVLNLLHVAARAELVALEMGWPVVLVWGGLMAAATAIRRRNRGAVDIRFDEEPSDALVGLALSRDGAYVADNRS